MHSLSGESMMDERRPYQRIGAISNSHVGNDFEGLARLFFDKEGVVLNPRHKIMIGVGAVKKHKEFDLGCDEQKIIVECKSSRWTESGKSPSAKLSVWTAAMYYFTLAPADYRKIMFVLRDTHSSKPSTLAAHYLKNHGHLVPPDVEFWEYDERAGAAERIR